MKTYVGHAYVKGHGYRWITIDAWDSLEAKAKLEVLYGEGTVTSVHAA